MRGIRDRHADVGGIQYQIREKVRVRDTYDIEVAPGEDAAPILAAVCIDRMSHD